MRTIRTLHLTLLLAALAVAPSAAQVSTGAEQAPTLTSQVLRAVVADHESVTDRQRAELVDILARDDVRKIAADRGFDLRRASSAVAALSDAQVAEVSSLVDSMPQDGEGGLGTITIGVGALIVGLLILILVT